MRSCTRSPAPARSLESLCPPQEGQKSPSPPWHWHPPKQINVKTIDFLLLQLCCSPTFPKSSPMISRLPPDLACITIFSSAKAEILISWRGKVNTEKLTTTSSPWRSGDLYPMVWQQVGFVAAVCRTCRSHLQRLPIPQQERKPTKVLLKFSTPPWYCQTYLRIMTRKK